ncbi:hypothetical protein BCR36DRAFT_580309 [Piromyces finnis]|uniref:MIT domain-containing protein n=1 Tax=Piromyces finnis TaxID=1754191 RepID=A0A1Y1VK64_9FUNG|nr:hypothetical protein BCR36DRAFT_580309 [Piromyces finnis]|eukprot:ORX57747.1 hypothetical protein BCR36DRAFT_580309 [Piromyces finnis]
MIERAHELVRKAKENVRKGNIQEAANLYSDAAEIYQNMYKQTNNEEAIKTIQQLYVQTDKEAKRIMKLIIDKQNKDINQQQQSNNSTPLLSTTNIPVPQIYSIKNQSDKYRYDTSQKTNIDNTFTQSSYLNNAQNLLNSPVNTKTTISNTNNFSYQNHGSINQINSSFNNYNLTNPKNAHSNGNNNTTLTSSNPSNTGINYNQPMSSNKNQELNSVRQNVLYKSNRPKPTLDTRNVVSRNYFIGQAITNSAILLPQNNYQDNTKTVTTNYRNQEPAVIPVTSLNSSTVDENTSSHFIDQSYFVLKETKKDEAEKAFIKFWDVIDNLVQNKVSMPVALLSVPLSKDDNIVNPIKNDLSTTSIPSSSKSSNRNSLTTNNETVKKLDQKSKNETYCNDFEIIDQKYIQEAKKDINFSEFDYLVIPQKEQPTKTLEEYQLENSNLKETLNQISNNYLLLPNTDEFKLALRKAKEYVKYNEYLRSSIVAGSENELEELKKRVAFLEENTLVKQIMQLEEENKMLKFENDKLKKENIKYKNQWEKFVAIAESKKKKKFKEEEESIIKTENMINENEDNNSNIKSPHLFSKSKKDNIHSPKYSSNDISLYSSNPPSQLFENLENNTGNKITKQEKKDLTESQIEIKDKENQKYTNLVNDEFQQNQLYFSSPTPEFDILQHMKNQEEIISQSHQIYSSMINEPTNNISNSHQSTLPEIQYTKENRNTDNENNNIIKNGINENQKS